MKILLVSMNSIHFQRWTDQLKDAGHEVFWFNIMDGDYVEKLSWVKQYFRWKLKYKNLKGRVFLKKRFPKLYSKLRFLIEHDTEKIFEQVFDDIKPDLVHSFVLYMSCVPILKVMKRNPQTKWIYSSWGSDLFYFQNKSNYLKGIKEVLPRVNYLFSDCDRDVQLAKKYGFKGEVLGVFPGGGGYMLEDYEPHVMPLEQRDVILVKGYQGRSGRAIQVLQALMKLEKKLLDYNVIVFAADSEVETFILKNELQKKMNITSYKKTRFLPHLEIIKLMGKAIIYIGNSNSDGMPNTLLEAIIMGAFPIQSNPGGSSAEVITHNENGLLIEDCNNSVDISLSVAKALDNRKLLEQAFRINQSSLKPRFDRAIIQNKVISAYRRALLD
ncbi:glycosyltransferase [Algibacter mikhailovii]|uniref:glycosyltransferase n=1 Tax=Algibacter mikhailovii TaxID=425498 RepID=UPI002493F2AC|nr:glycosyltransferase [Algibacter mikhailovii]